MTRVFPTIDDVITRPTRAISFVCVRFCDDFEHNIMKSDCVHDPLNELIVVNNKMNMTFTTLGEAICHGLKDAKNDLIAVVHEDVLLLPGWQTKLEKSLSKLESHDPDWGISGAVGWNKNSDLEGHWSDPRRYINTFGDNDFCEVSRLDEQILIFRKSSGIEFDVNLPSIHNIGGDISRQASRRGLKTYVINAPTIHKYADQKGDLIQSAEDSPKIVDRRTFTYKADKQCSDEYYSRKWDLKNKSEYLDSDVVDYSDTRPPIILLGRGGGGTRLLSSIAQDAGLFIGNRVNISGDCMDMVPAIYRTIFRKYCCPDIEQKKLSIADLRQAAGKMIASKGVNQQWGFKLPELLLILPEIEMAFPKAQFVNIKRNPIGTVLRRSHMTARVDNHIGRVALKEASQYFSFSMQKLLEVSSISRMAISTMHQLSITQEFLASISPERWLEISFEDIISNPEIQLEEFSKFCNLPIKSRNILSLVSYQRAQPKLNEFAVEDVKRVESLISRYSNEGQ